MKKTVTYTYRIIKGSITGDLYVIENSSNRLTTRILGTFKSRKLAQTFLDWYKLKESKRIILTQDEFNKIADSYKAEGMRMPMVAIRQQQWDDLNELVKEQHKLIDMLYDIINKPIHISVGDDVECRLNKAQEAFEKSQQKP